MEVKGTAVQTIPLFVRSKLGDDAYRRWLEALTPAARGVMSGVVLATNWYPIREILVEPTKLICDMFYGGKIDGAVAQGKFSADHGLKGIYRLFVKLGTPEFIIGKAGAILPTYYRGSAMVVVEKSHCSVTVRITAFPEPSTIVEHRIKGWIEQALIICGVKNSLATIAISMTKGAPHTDFVVTWK